MSTITGKVTAVKRHGHTKYGNPTMSIQLDTTGDTWHRISNDSGLVYGIENSEWKLTPHTFELTAAGRLSGVTHRA